MTFAGGYHPFCIKNYRTGLFLANCAFHASTWTANWRRSHCLAISNVLLPFALLVCSRSAHAHVKWFADYDLKPPPRPIGDVLTGQFVYFFLASVLTMYAFYWIDRYLYRKCILEDVLRRACRDRSACVLCALFVRIRRA
jgi:hypothetical protein